MKKNLALFDFDGTISSKDTMLDFILFSFGAKKSLKGLIILSPVLFFFALKIIDNNSAKQHIFKYFFGGMTIDEIKYLGACYTKERIHKIIRPNCIERINWHKKNNHEISIVSASLEYWLKPWCDNMGLKLIATKLEIIDNKITGNYDGANCHGNEKLKRIKEIYDLNYYDYIFAYGDTDGDKQMLEIANESFYKPFR